MVKIRLMRVGKRKQPSYRVVVADSRSPRDGRIIEAIGQYQPREDPSVISIDTDRAVYWLERGAQPSDQVRNLLRISGAWAAFTGEQAPAAAPAAKPRKATAASSVRVTPAASVDGSQDVEPGDVGVDEPAELPEAQDQVAAAPEADEPTSS